MEKYWDANLLQSSTWPGRKCGVTLLFLFLSILVEVGGSGCTGLIMLSTLITSAVY